MTVLRIDSDTKGGAGKLVSLGAGTSDFVAAPLIVTKLMMPAPPRRTVRRARLHHLLDAGLGGRLTLVVAPAGFGKTVLVTDWLSSMPARPVGWVSLDRDDDPSRFWAYVLAALAGAGVDLPPATDGLVERPDARWPEEALASLVNALAVAAAEVVLVLDDYHQITDARIHRDVSFLVDRRPPGLHLVIVSRTDPPLVLARYKAHGEVIEARTKDLAFTTAEMTGFLDNEGVVLTDDQRDALFARLGGWAAALRLVTVWVAGHHDHATALTEFAASDATIADYLTSEVLGQLPARLRRFLLWTSILPLLTGPLCDAVTAEGGGTETLAELDRRGLFVEAVNRGRDSFRYHQLFEELLRLELLRAYPDMVAELHRRASGWFAANGYAIDAIGHALAAQDWASVLTLMVGQTLSIGSHYQPSALGEWLSSLPGEVLEASPFFLTLHAFVLSNTGRPDEGRRALERARALEVRPGSDLEPATLAALQHAISAALARLDCDLAAARRDALAVEQELRAGDSTTDLARMAHAIAGNALAGTMFWHGDVEGAERLLRDIDRETDTHQLARMRTNCLSATALVLATTGRLRQAEAVAAEALDLARPVGVAAMYQTNPAILAAAIVALQRAEPTRAHQQLTIVTERARRHRDRGPLVAAGVLLARLAARDGDVAGAFALLDGTKAVWPGWEPPIGLQAMVAEEEARTCLLDGDVAAARAVHRHLRALPDETPVVALAQQMTEARILCAEGQLNAGSHQFGLAADLALSCGQLSLAVESLVGAAVASRSAGQVASALTSIERAVALARDETIVGPFIWEAPSVRPLLLEMEQGPGEHTALGFRQRLLRTMGVPGRLPSPNPDHRPSAVDSLSDRELTVLRLLGGTLTNLEIAAALTISPNTLKTHIKHIYGKLGVKNRQQAVTRSHEIDLR